MIWTPELRDLAIAKWNDGLSAKQCADIVSGEAGQTVTRQSIIGLIYRARANGVKMRSETQLDIERLQKAKTGTKPVDRGPKVKKPRSPNNFALRNIASRMDADKPVVPVIEPITEDADMVGVPLVDHRSHGCRFVIADPVKGDAETPYTPHLFCPREATSIKRPYCSVHMARMYRREVAQ